MPPKRNGILKAPVITELAALIMEFACLSHKEAPLGLLVEGSYKGRGLTILGGSVAISER